jgi:DnaK suppressor protein
MAQNTEHFKKLLLAEVAVLEKELSGIGRKNPNNKTDWEAVEPKMDTDTTEDGDMASTIEQYESNSAVLNNLEIRLAEVKAALLKIENGIYGMCEVSGEPIEEDRLEANPAAKTCKMHMES